MKSGWWRWLFLARMDSPRGLLLLAGVAVLIFLVLHACGLREYTTLLTGTAPAGKAVNRPTAILALFYMMAHLATVVVAPVLALAALGWAGWNYGRRQKDEG
jgi:hypothetical protein